VLAKLEEGRAATGGIAAGPDDLPLFAAAQKEEPQPDPVAAALAGVDADTLSPREALDLVYELKTNFRSSRLIRMFAACRIW
jgi:DNA mismatch repair protein MutS